MVTEMICACINVLYCQKKKCTVSTVIYLVVLIGATLGHCCLLDGDYCEMPVDEHRSNLLFIYTEVS